MFDKSEYSFMFGNDVSWMEEFVNAYFEKIYMLYSQNTIPYESYLDFLILISDSGLCNTELKWEEMGYTICKKIKEQIETEGINPFQIGMFSSLGHQAFAVNLYHKKTGNVQKFARTLNELLLTLAAKKAQHMMDNNIATFASHYDCIAGISGILYYLIDQDELSNSYMMDSLIDYLVYLTDMHIHSGDRVYNFHIPFDNLYTDLERKLYPDGYINLGMAHGIVGPLLALSKVADKHSNTVDGAINRIISIYDKYIDYIDKRPVWPCYIGNYEMINKIRPRYTSLLKIQRSSWCYGNVSIARGFQLTYRNIGNSHLEEKYYKYLESIIDTDIENYHLDNLGLCHGISSVLAVASLTYYEKQSLRLKKGIMQCIDRMSQLIEHNALGSRNFICDYFENDLSLLQGSGGMVAAILSSLNIAKDFGKIMMIF